METQTQTPMGPQAGSNFKASDGTQLDPTAATLTRAIRDVESSKDYSAKGASGEFGAYQWMPQNFETAAKKYGLDPSDKSATNQDKVAYHQIKEQLDAGHTQSQTASWWNSGKYDPTGNVGTNKQGVKFDTPSYVKNVQKAYQTQLGNSSDSGFVNPKEQQKTGNNFVAPPSQTTQTNDVSQTSQPEKKQGLLSKVVQGAGDIYKSIASPFLGLAATPVQLLAKATGRPDPYANKAFGGIESTNLEGGVGKAIEKKAGDLAQVGSYFVPGEGVLGAAGMGALQGGGAAMSKGGDVAQVATQTGLGAAIGAGTAGAVKLAGKGVQKLGESISGEGITKATQGIKDAYGSALNLNAGERAFEKRTGADLADVLMKNQATLGRYENGTLDASAAIDKLQGMLEPLNTQATELLNKPQGVVANISLEDTFKTVSKRIQDSTYAQAEKNALIAKAKELLDAEASQYGTDVAPVISDQIKRGFWNNAFKRSITSTDALYKNVSYLIGNSLKTAEEAAVKGTDTELSLKAINEARSQLVDAVTRLSKLDGVRILKGGRLGNMAGGVVGSIAGAAGGFGIPGALAGDYFGTEAAKFLNNPATKIMLAGAKAKAQGLLPSLLGKSAKPIGSVISNTGRAVTKSARGAGLLGNILTK